MVKYCPGHTSTLHVHAYVTAFSVLSALYSEQVTTLAELQYIVSVNTNSANISTSGDILLSAR